MRRSAVSFSASLLLASLVAAACSQEDTGLQADISAVGTSAAPSTASAATQPAVSSTISSSTSSTARATTLAPTTTGAPITTVPLIPQTTVKVSTPTTQAQLPPQPGAQTLRYEVGPYDIQPGQNNIDYTPGIPQPWVNGWITGFKADLRFKDGSVPPVDVVHLHHGVWLNTSVADLTASVPERFFAAGEEKTAVKLPAPYGYRYRTSDRWMLNYMLHNLTPTTRKVWVTYEVEFIPDTSPLAADMVPARPVWMDVQNGSVYPVFDSIKGSGDGATFTYPDQAVNPYPGARKNEWVVDRDGVLVATAGHLHPGGLHTELKARRGTSTVRLFRSEAKYFEPAGAVSWDVAMTATTPDWRVAVKAGDVLSTSATYDSATASWYESMGIMVVWMGDTGLPAPDPFATAVDKPGMITHGHLKENDNHGGAADPNYLDLTTLPSEPWSGVVEIRNWMYGKGDMFSGTSVPTVKPGQTITYDNKDAPIGKGQWHTLTACKAPCNRATGIAYPIADADIPFDSGELGTGGPPTANRTTWTIPSTLAAGTYTYFCRIHPLMRGAFRVEP